MRNTLKTAGWVIVGVLLIIFAVANRQRVVFTLDPTGSTDPSSALAFELPLFVLAFILLIVGVVVGGAASWLRQRKWRKAARELESEVRAFRTENESLRRDLEAAKALPARVDPPAAAQP